MRENLKIISVLTVICTICGLLLVYVFNSASARIEQNQREYLYRAIYNIDEKISSVEEVKLKEKIVYKLYNKDHNLIGYAYLHHGQGYQDKIKILIALDEKLEKIMGIEIIESKETPGLGARISEESFRKQFKNLDVSRPLECVKRPPQESNQIQAISSATISSKAVVNIVNKGINQLREILRNE